MKGKSVCVWCGIFSGGIIGPYFFPATVNQNEYLTLLTEFLLPELQLRGLVNHVLFQQDGAPAHWSQRVRQWLDENLGTWIGRDGPIPWPPRSPDLTPPDFYLWGLLKQEVYKTRPKTTEDLKAAISARIALITPAEIEKTCRSVEKKIQNVFGSRWRSHYQVVMEIHGPMMH